MSEIVSMRVYSILGVLALTFGSVSACLARPPETPPAAIAVPPDAATNSLRPDVSLMLPMRDGTRLATYITLPDVPGPYPTVLVRTVYRESLTGNWGKFLQRNPYLDSGYAVVFQTTRGAGFSEGTFRFLTDDAEDGYDTIEWIARQPWSDGQVAMDGGSYAAMTQLAAASASPPHLAAIMPQVPSVDFFRESPRIGGVFLRFPILSWLHVVSVKSRDELDGQFLRASSVLEDDAWRARLEKRPLRDAAVGLLTGDRLAQYRRFLEHPTLDEYWGTVQLDAGNYRNIDIPVLMVGGNFDLATGSFGAWSALERYAPNPDTRHFIVGPWTHGQAQTGVAESFSAYELDDDASIPLGELKVAFLDTYLRSRTPSMALPDRIRLYITGANEWLELSSMTDSGASARQLLLSSSEGANSAAGDGLLSDDRGTGAYDEIAIDPTHPIVFAADYRHTALDYSDLERRTDVLVYTTPPLCDAATVIGQPSLTLYTSAASPDADIIVHLTEVMPDGRSLALGAGGALRLRYREGFDKTAFMTPGQVYEVNIPLGHVGHQIAPGNRLRVDILGTEFPFFDPNPNTDQPVAEAIETRKTRLRIHHDEVHRSRLTLPLVAEFTPCER